MSGIALDTLKFANRLKAAGRNARLAEEHAEALRDALTEQNLLATKIDLSDLKIDLIKWVAGMLLAQAAVVASLIKLL